MIEAALFLSTWELEQGNTKEAELYLSTIADTEDGKAMLRGIRSSNRNS